MFFVPIWEVTSFYMGECNGTDHHQRMRQASLALRAALSQRSSVLPSARNWHSHSGLRAKGPSSPGFDHLIVSTGCIERARIDARDARLAERLTRPLAQALAPAIVGRDRAYSTFYLSSAVVSSGLTPA